MGFPEGAERPLSKGRFLGRGQANRTSALSTVIQMPQSRGRPTANQAMGATSRRRGLRTMPGEPKREPDPHQEGLIGEGACGLGLGNGVEAGCLSSR